MGIGEMLKENRKVKTAIASVILVVAAVWVARGFVNSRSKPQAFFTVDDGATWFLDDAGKLPPFTHEGKPAVMCFVFKSGDNGKPWVGYLKRFTAEGLKGAASIEPVDRHSTPPWLQNEKKALYEVKKPHTGDAGWVPNTDSRAIDIQQPVAPDGAKTNVVPIDPNE